jgi:hypothetical protein
LLVLLKGNDVWVYGDSNMKALPESYEMRPAGDRCDYEFQAIIAFGPPGEYGETSIHVPNDRGQPSMLTWLRELRNCSARTLARSRLVTSLKRQLSW